MTFRTATRDDIPALHTVIESAFRGESSRRGWTHEADLLDGQRTDPDALLAIVDDPAQTLIVVEETGELLGCVLIADKGDGVAYLGMLTVRPDLQSAGLGGRLVEAGERHARDTLGARSMEMTVIVQRAELIAWYVRRGYRDTGRRAPFPLDDPRFGLPRTRDLSFVVLEKALQA